MFTFKKMLAVLALSVSLIPSYAAICVATDTQDGTTVYFRAGEFNSQAQGYNAPTGNCYVPSQYEILPVHLSIFITEPSGITWECDAGSYLNPHQAWLLNVKSHTSVIVAKGPSGLAFGCEPINMSSTNKR